MYKQNCFKFQPIAEVWVSWDHQKVRNLWNHSADLLNMDLFYVRVKTCQTFPGVEYGLHALNLPIIISLFDRFVAKMPLVPISIDRLMLSMKSGGYAVYLPLIHTSMYGHFTGFTNNLWRSLFRKQRDSASRDIGGNRIGHVQLRPVAKSWVYPSKTSDGAPKHNRISWNLFRSPPHIEKHFFSANIRVIWKTLRDTHPVFLHQNHGFYGFCCQTTRNRWESWSKRSKWLRSKCSKTTRSTVPEMRTWFLSNVRGDSLTWGFKTI